jgi:tetratricopeptide (TPR) repeat protein
MLTDRVPFDGDTPLTVGVKQKTEAPKDPREFNERIQGELSRLILKCLAKEKENRFQSAAEVKSELEKIEQGLPTTDRVFPKRKTLTSREITVQFSLKKILIPVLAIGLLITGALIIWQLLPQKEPAPTLSEKPSLAVMYFENRSGIEDLDKTLVDMLTTNMSRYEGLDVVSSQRLFDILKQIGKQDVETIDRKTATEVAEKAGVKTMLLGSIMKIGDKVIINSHLTDVQSGNIIDSAQAEGGKIDEDIFNMINKLTAEIGMKLNALPKEKELGLKITDVTTSSFEAYQYYQKGLHHLWRFSFGEAAKNFQTAVDIDPSFSMAHFWLTMAQTTFGYGMGSPFLDTGPILKTLAQAKKYSQRATEKERLLIDIGISYFGFDFEKMRALCEEMIKRYPDEKLGYLFLAQPTSFVKEIDFEDVKDTIEKTLELDPTDGISYNSLAYTNALQKDREGLASTIKKYKAVQPDVYNPYHTAWETHMMLGLFDEAFGFLDELSENVPGSRGVHFWRGVHYLMVQDTDKARDKFQIWYDSRPENTGSPALYFACSYLVDGKYEKAASELRKRIERAQRENRTRDEVFGHYFLGKVLAYQRKHDEAIQEYGQAERLSDKLCRKDFNPYSVYAQYLIGLASAEKGDYNTAKDHANMILSMIQEGNYSPLHSVFADLLSAEIDVDQKNAEAARATLDKITYYSLRHHSPHFRKLQVSVKILQGDVEGAMEYYRSSFENWITTNIGARSLDMFDYFEERSKLDYRLAQMYENLGDTAKAIEHYEKFLDLWKDADPGIAEVEDARKRLAGLKG